MDICFAPEVFSVVSLLTEFERDDFFDVVDGLRSASSSRDRIAGIAEFNGRMVIEYSTSISVTHWEIRYTVHPAAIHITNIRYIGGLPSSTRPN